MSEQTKTRRPWHMWVVPTLLILMGLIPCRDFIAVQMKDHEYMQDFGFTPEQIKFWFSYPIWAVLIWGIAVFATELGAVLLLCKKSLAVHLSLAGLLFYVLAMVRQYGFTDFTESHPEPKWVIANVMIFVVLLGQLLYARAMTSRGVLS